MSPEKAIGMKTELNKISTTKDTEVMLFRNMSSILSATYHVAFIGETHQQYVTYQSVTVGRAAKREISDLWIVAFSPTQSQIRMTFLQAKYHRGVLDHHNRTFSGDYFQFELLSQRPTLLTNVNHKYNFPLTILSFSCSDSVGSYGVFFIDAAGQIDLAYCCAKNLSRKTPLPTSYRSYPVDLDIPFYHGKKLNPCSCGKCLELESCFDIDTFTDAILKLEIGAELVHHPIIISFVRNVLNPHTSNATVKQFVDFVDNSGLITTFGSNESFESLTPNLLLVNVDKK